MSLDIFLQRFERGDASDADGDLILEVLRPYFASLPVDGFVELRTSDGAADLYCRNPGQGLMVNHAAGRAIWDLLADLAIRASLTVMPVGGPTCVVSEAAIDHLPAELRTAEVRVIRSGADLLAAVVKS